MVYKVWRGAGVVERGGLENRCALAYPGFESLSLRQTIFSLVVLALANEGSESLLPSSIIELGKHEL